MEKSSVNHEVTLEAVEKLLARGFRFLRFPASIEAYFEQQTGRARCRHLIVYGLVALGLYELFLVSDWRLVPDVMETALLVRMGVVGPIAFAIVGVLFFNPRAWIREGLEAAVTVFVAVSILYIMLSSDSPLVGYHHYGIILVILFSNIVQRLHFWYALSASVATLAVYVLALQQVETLPHEAAVSAGLVLFGGVVFTMIANYNLERDMRIDFLKRTRDRMRNEKLDAISKLDPLTALANRRHLDRVLEDMWAERGDGDQSVAVILLDVDHFKAYNDRYGHPAGDVCLKRVAALAASQLRSSEDLAVRYGGEELLVLLRGADLDDGLRVAERIRRSVEEAAIPHEAGISHQVVTISAGVAAAPISGNIDYSELISAADTALYAAKRAGRNCIWPRRAAANEKIRLLPYAAPNSSEKSA